MATTSHAVEWILLDHAAGQPVAVGDLVSIDAGGMPIYRVVALSPTGAVLQHETGPTTLVAPLDRFRWRGCERRAA